MRCRPREDMVRGGRERRARKHVLEEGLKRS